MKKQKFQINEEVFIIENRKIKKKRITEMQLHKQDNEEELAYGFSKPSELVQVVCKINVYEKHIFKTKEELIKSL